MSKSNTLLAILIVAALSLAIITGMVGYRMGSQKLPQNISTNSTQTPKESTKSELYNSRSATILGKITSINGKVLTVKNNNNISGAINLADSILISKLGKNNRPASPSSNIKDIETGKDVLINLEYMGGDFKVVSITYQPSN